MKAALRYVAHLCSVKVHVYAGTIWEAAQYHLARHGNYKLQCSSPVHRTTTVNIRSFERSGTTIALCTLPSTTHAISVAKLCIQVYCTRFTADLEDSDGQREHRNVALKFILAVSESIRGPSNVGPSVSFVAISPSVTSEMHTVPPNFHVIPTSDTTLNSEVAFDRPHMTASVV